MRTMVGYVYLAVWLILSGICFVVEIVNNQTPSLALLFRNMGSLLMFSLPFLSMNSFAVEQQQHTDFWLQIGGASSFGIVMGKFFAQLAVYTIGLGITLLYPLVIALLASVSLSEILVCYLGLWLLGAALLALCTFISAIAARPLHAFLLSLVAIFLLWLISLLLPYATDSLVFGLLQAAGVYSHFVLFERGILSLVSFVYMLSFSFFFLYLTSRAIARHKWGKELRV